jgi:hypothetical protein
MQLVGDADFLRSFILSRAFGAMRFRYGSDKGTVTMQPSCPGYCTFASCRTSLFHFLFPSLCGLSTFKTLYSVLNTCHFLKSSKSLHVSTWIGHPQVLIIVQGYHWWRELDLRLWPWDKTLILPVEKFKLTKTEKCETGEEQNQEHGIIFLTSMELFTKN